MKNYLLLISTIMFFFFSCEEKENIITPKETRLPNLPYQVITDNLGKDTIFVDIAQAFNVTVAMENIKGVIPLTYRFISGKGTISLNGTEANSNLDLTLNSTQTFNFTPSQKGKVEILFTADHGYDSPESDTVSFFVRDQDPPFTIELQNTQDLFETNPSGEFEFDIKLTTSDIFNEVEYFLNYVAPIPLATELFVDNLPIQDNGSIGFGNKTITVKVDLNAHTGGSYKIEFNISDTFKESIPFEINFKVEENKAPEVTFPLSTIVTTNGPTTDIGNCNCREVCINPSCFETKTVCDDINQIEFSYFLDVTFTPTDDVDVISAEARIQGTAFTKENISVTKDTPTKIRFDIGSNTKTNCGGSPSPDSGINGVNVGGIVEVRVRDDEGLWSEWIQIEIK